jgi:hypothetical protein
MVFDELTDVAKTLSAAVGGVNAARAARDGSRRGSPSLLRTAPLPATAAEPRRTSRTVQRS